MRLYFLTLKIAALFHRKPKQPATGTRQPCPQADTDAGTADLTLLTAFAQAQTQLVIAENTRQADEYLLARYVAEHPDVCLILAPDKADAKRQHRLFNLFHGRYIRLSEADAGNLLTCHTLLMDNSRIPACLYGYAKTAYIGGGFNCALPDTPQAACSNTPMLFGPYYKYNPAACNAITAGTGCAVKNYKELERALDLRLTSHRDTAEADSPHLQP